MVGGHLIAGLVRICDKKTARLAAVSAEGTQKYWTNLSASAGLQSSVDGLRHLHWVLGRKLAASSGSPAGGRCVVNHDGREGGVENIERREVATSRGRGNASRGDTRGSRGGRQS